MQDVEALLGRQEFLVYAVRVIWRGGRGCLGGIPDPGGLLANDGPGDILSRIALLYTLKLFIYARMFKNFKARILNSIITRSEMGQ